MKNAELNVNVMTAFDKGMDIFLPLISDVKLSTLLDSLRLRVKGDKKTLKLAKEKNDASLVESLQVSIESDKILINAIEKQLAK